MNNVSKLPKWARDRIAELEKELRHWQNLYVELANGAERMRRWRNSHG